MQSALFENVLLNASHSSLQRSAIPSFLYGCAWKKERTADLVHKALKAGFKGFDVAAQPKHYREDLAGEGMRRAISDGIRRQDLFIQTKFTPPGGQDLNNMPYDAKLPVVDAVRMSIATSLHSLYHTSDPNDTYIDCLVLHSPLKTLRDTKEAWKTCENFVPHAIKNLGISNVDLGTLQALWDFAEVKPAVVQNRFYADSRYDVELRKFCRDKGVVFQSFWTLTGNPQLLKLPATLALAKMASVEPPSALYALVMGLSGTIVLNGTQNHMESDLADLQKIQSWALENEYDWENILKHFKDATGDNSPGL